MLLRRNFILIYFTLLSVFAVSICADDNFSVEKPPYTFQYNAFDSLTLPPEMSQRYHFKRSKESAIVNITVIDNRSKIRYKGVKASISGKMQNLIGQHRKLEFKEIHEDQAYYYIAQVPIEHNDVVHIIIQAQPHDSEQSYEFKFVRQFATR